MAKKGEVTGSIKGHVNYNKFGSKMIVSEDRGFKDIDVYFPEYSWTAYHRLRQNFKDGRIRCPYEKTVLNIGYLGEGIYKQGENGKDTKCYKTWKSMLERCYDDKHRSKNPTYIDCSVCDEWLCFQNFAKWYYENYYELPSEKVSLDKDILNKGNKVYSPYTCVFVPERINGLFIKRQGDRGEYPIGVSYRKDTNKLRVACNTTENGIRKEKHLAYYPPNQVNEAFLCYKTFKEAYIKQVAEEYKELIPTKLYDALYRYEVEITD